MKTPLFFETRFWPIWTANALGAFSDNLLRQALIIGVAFGWIKMPGMDGRETIPLIGSLFAVSMLVFAPISGQLAEKYETSMLFRRIKFCEFVLMALAALGFFFNWGWLLVAIMFAMGAQAAFFSPARMSAMPKYLAPHELLRGNGFCNAGLYVSIILGLFLGGMLIAQSGGRIIVAAALLCASLAGWLAVLAAPPAAANAPELKLTFNPIPQTIEMLRLAAQAPGVFRPLLGTALFYYGATLVTVLVPIYVKEALYADEAVATAIMGLFAVGTLVGAISAAALSKRKSGLGYSALGVAVSSGAALAVYGLTPFAATSEAQSLSLLTNNAGGIALTASLILAAASMGFYLVPLQAATQRRAPAHERGRILAVSIMANATAAMLGSLSIFAVTRSGADPSIAFLVVALIQALVAGYMIRRRMRVPHGLFDEDLALSVENSGAARLSAQTAGR
jgi:MFS family permease